MKEQLKSALQSIFDKNEAIEDAAHKAQAERIARESEFQTRFMQKSEEVIKPALREIVDYIKSRGTNARILENASGPSRSVDLELNMGSVEGGPILRFIGETISGKVRIYVSPMVQRKRDEEMDLDSINADLVQDRAVTFIAAAIG